jgi:hypothetical protein
MLFISGDVGICRLAAVIRKKGLASLPRFAFTFCSFSRAMSRCTIILEHENGFRSAGQVIDPVMLHVYI